MYRHNQGGMGGIAMSREDIKFRGKRFDNDGWAYGNLIIDDSGNCEIVDYEDNCELRYDIRGGTIGRFTGLHDSKGKEIYEGDIIKSGYNNIHHVISYSKSLGAFTATMINRYMHNTDGLKTECHAEQRWITQWHKTIVGNIHDNPDLLKGSNQ